MLQAKNKCEKVQGNLSLEVKKQKWRDDSNPEICKKTIDHGFFLPSRRVTEAMLWIKEVEMVDSVDDLKSSRPFQGYTHFWNFEMLDARIASALNKIIQHSSSKEKVSPEEQKAQKEDRFIRGRQIAHMIYDYFRVTGAHDTVLDHADLFTITLRDDDVQEFDTRWGKIPSSMTKIPT